ncbi:MAG: thiamine pyrophosphate-dependent enzyme [Sphingomonadaceae bacterium]
MATTLAGDRPQLDEKRAFVLNTYRQSAFIRAFEAEALALTQTKPPLIQGSIHLCAGQEVVPLAAIAALREDDQVICTYRGHGWALAAGVDPRAVMAEICHKEVGLNGGRCGSAYMMAPDTRFIGENSIVGAGTTIACGIAIANLVAKNDRVVIVTIGDGAMNQGSVHEAMAFAAVRQLPVVFVVENNGWSELTATADMFRIDRLAMRGKGYGIPAATISGTDPIAVCDSVAAAAVHARAGNGPSLLEFKLPRLWGHYHRDIEHYRPKADRAAAEANDPLVVVADQLAAMGIDRDALARIRDEEVSRAKALADEVVQLPDPDATTAAAHVIAPRRAVVPRLVETKAMTGIEAVTAAIQTELERDPAVIFFGEDVGKSGGIFGAARNLQREFGADRVFDMPIAENAILGSAVGAALGGLRPVAEIMWADFLFVAFDQLINQAANIRYVTRGKTSLPLVVRTQQGATPGSCSQHSQSIEAIIAHVPGLKVAVVGNAADNYAVLRAAIRDDDPCVVIEARATYQIKGDVSLTDDAEPVGKARVRRSGTDVLIVSWGTMVDRALEAAERLADGEVSIGVIDLRWLVPLDVEALDAAVDGCRGNVLVVHEAVRTGGFGAEIALGIIERRHALGKTTQVKRLTTPDVRIPASPALQVALIPSVDAIEAAVRDLVDPS